MSGCKIHNCKQHGIALFNSLEDVEGSAPALEALIEHGLPAPLDSDSDSKRTLKGSCCNGQGLSGNGTHMFRTVQVMLLSGTPVCLTMALREFW